MTRLLTILFLLAAFTVSAADICIRPGASGNDSGSDWANAMPAIPGTLSSANTYWLADGNYGNYTIDDANATLKKATAGSHVTETGWQSGYGDGSANFNRIVIYANGITVDGTVGQWASWLPDYEAYGIRVNCTGSYSGISTSPSGTGISSHPARQNITLKHFEVYRTGSYGTSQDNMEVYPDGTWDISYMWNHDAGRVAVMVKPDGANMTIEYSVLDRHGHEQSSSQHSEMIHWFYRDHNDGGTLTFRYNYMRDWRSTGGIILSTHNSTLYAYGNVFMSSEYWSDDYNSNGVLNGNGNYSGQNGYFYNNTFYNISDKFSIATIGGWDSSVTRNNLFYDVEGHGGTFGISGTVSHNWYYSTPSTPGSSVQNGSGDPFVDKANMDFHLSANTDAGSNLGSPFDEDMDGNTRTSWTRGAFEYGGTPPADTPPSITTQPVGGTYAAGANHTFSVIAAGTDPLAYQWKQNGTNEVGETNSIYTIDPITVADDGTYTVVITNAVSPYTVESFPAALSVTTDPIINVSPASYNFGTATVGASNVTTATVWNTGSAALVGTATVSAPFYVISNGTYNVAVGATNIVGLSFEPSTAGTFTGDVTLTDGGGDTISLTGYSPVVHTDAWRATNGEIVSPFYITNSYIVQDADTVDNANPNGSGEARYLFQVETAGVYTVSMSLLATNSGRDAVWVDIDNDTMSPTNYCLFDVAAAPWTNYVQWRGNGEWNTPEFPTNYWTLSVGVHELVIFGSSKDSQWQDIIVALVIEEQAGVAPSVELNPSGESIAVGESMFLASVGANFDGYYWYQNDVYTTNGVGVNPANSNHTYVAQLSATTNHAGSYYVVYSNATAPMATSATAVIVVNPLPGVTNAPPPGATTNLVQAAYRGASVVLTVVATGGTAPYTYQWHDKDSAEISGATNASMTVTASAANEGQFRCIVTDANSLTADGGWVYLDTWNELLNVQTIRIGN